MLKMHKACHVACLGSFALGVKTQWCNMADSLKSACSVYKYKKITVNVTEKQKGLGDYTLKT